MPKGFFFFFFDLFIYPEESRYMMNGFRLSPAVGLAFPYMIIKEQNLHLIQVIRLLHSKFQNMSVSDIK